MFLKSIGNLIEMFLKSFEFEPYRLYVIGIDNPKPTVLLEPMASQVFCRRYETLEVYEDASVSTVPLGPTAASVPTVCRLCP